MKSEKRHHMQSLLRLMGESLLAGSHIDDMSDELQ